MANDILAREIAEDIFMRYGVEARYTEDCIILVDNPSNDLDDLDELMTIIVEYIREYYDGDANYTLGIGESELQVIL